MRKIFIIYLLLFSVSVFAKGGVISPGQIGSKYEGDGDGYVILELTRVGEKNGKYLFEVRTEVASIRGWGEVDGSGEYKNNQLVVTPSEGLQDSPKCYITVKFSQFGQKATVSEKDCLFYHGGGVAWYGQKLIKIK